MLRTIAHRILTGLATLSVLIAGYYTMTWWIYRTRPPLCPQVDPELYYYCLTYADQLKMMSTPWRPPYPAFDAVSIVIAAGVLLAVFLLREWIGGTPPRHAGRTQIDGHWRL